MAGISLRLTELVRREDVMSPVLALAGAMVVAGAPWLLTVGALLVINVFAGVAVSYDVLVGFRGLIIYSYAISLTAAAPFTLISCRMLSDLIYGNRSLNLRGLFLSAVCVTLTVAALLSLIVYQAVFRTLPHVTISGMMIAATISVVWVALAFAGALRDFGQIALAFLIGLAVGVVGAVYGAIWFGTAPAMIWGFAIGQIVIFCWLSARLLASSDIPLTSLKASLGDFWRGLRRHAVLGLGALVAALGVWIDKWIVWGSRFGEEIPGGLYHAPIYDSPLFIAFLAIIPALGWLVVNLETWFVKSYQDYYRAIAGHATLTRLRSLSRSLTDGATSMLVRTVLLQLPVIVIIVLAAPKIIELAGLEYRQVSVLRFGAVGTMFHFVFIAATSLLLFFERYARFALLQAFFLISLGFTTILSIEFGIDTLGLGYLVATVISGCAAFFVLERTMWRLEYYTFIVGNADDGTKD